MPSKKPTQQYFDRKPPLSKQFSLFDLLDYASPSKPVTLEQAPDTANTTTKATVSTGPIDNSATKPFIENFRLIRSRRKTVSLSVKNAVLEVRAPLRAPCYWINDVINDRRQWIESQIQLQIQQREEVFRVIDGQQLSILGDTTYTIHHCTNADASMHFKRKLSKSAKIVENGNKLHLYLPGEISHNLQGSHTFASSSPHNSVNPYQSIHDENEKLATKAFNQWIKKKAEEVLRPLVFEIYAQMLSSLSPKSLALAAVTFRVTKSKWGHCSHEGVVQLNPTLLMAPKSVCQYVITHELCHLTHRNHSKRFWAMVAKHDENWKESEQWLDDQGHQLALGSLL